MKKKQKQEKQQPVTIKMVANLIDTAPAGWYYRKDIAEALGRKKTSHVIRTIEAAADAGLIVREWYRLPNGLYAAIYSAAKQYPDESTEREPNPGNYTMPDRMYSDGREEYPDSPLPMGMHD